MAKRKGIGEGKTGTGGGKTPMCEPPEGRDLRGEPIRLMRHLLNGEPPAGGGPAEGSTRRGINVGLVRETTCCAGTSWRKGRH